MGSTITLHRLAKTYPGGRAAVRQVSLTIEKSEFLVLLGPSGCGKSTLLRMIAGLGVAQGRPLLIGLRPEAVRIAEPARSTPFERAVTGVVELVEFQGHESLLHLSLGGQRADVPPQLLPPDTGRPVGGITTGLLQHLRRHTTALLSRGRTAADHPHRSTPAPERKSIGELVIRAVPGTAYRRGQHLPLLIDVRNLLVFDEYGERISPDPTQAPDL
ncbi:ATP-binding cassette domain-containing protein [Streptomyces altiplanensis]